MPKDILDYRYHDKRRLYLSAIANELSKEVSFTDIEIQGWREGNDISKPILVFKLASDEKTCEPVDNCKVSVSPRPS